jgi:hypothetical protein
LNSPPLNTWMKFSVVQKVCIPLLSWQDSGISVFMNMRVHGRRNKNVDRQRDDQKEIKDVVWYWYSSIAGISDPLSVLGPT